MVESVLRPPLIIDEHKLGMAFAVIGMMAIISALVLGLYSGFIDTDSPIIYGEVQTTNLDGVPTVEFRPGETLLLVRSYCVLRRQSVDFDRRLVSPDGTVSFSLDAATLILPTGCITRGVRPIHIPPYVTLGAYRILSSGSYSNNFLHHGIFDAPAPLITVIR